MQLGHLQVRIDARQYVGPGTNDWISVHPLPGNGGLSTAVSSQVALSLVHHHRSGVEQLPHRLRGRRRLPGDLLRRDSKKAVQRALEDPRPQQGFVDSRGRDLDRKIVPMCLSGRQTLGRRRLRTACLACRKTVRESARPCPAGAS